MKKILIFISIPIIAILIAILGLVFFVNPNQFKPLIVEQTKAQTGFELVIDGDISWSFFPHVGFSIGETQLLNPNGFKQDQVVSFDQAALDISVLPLLENKLDIGNITLDGADIFVQKLKDGRSNLDTAIQSAEKNANQETVADNDSQAAEDTQSEDKLTSAWQINLAGITVNNAKLQLIDEQAGTNLLLSDVNFSLSEFEFGEWSSAEFNITGQNNQQNFSAEGSTEFKVSADLKDYELKGTQLNATFKDPTTDITKLALNLDAFKFDSPAEMNVTVQGQAADMNLDIKQSATLTVDKAMTFVRLADLTVTGEVDGDALPISPISIDMSSDMSFDLTKQYLDFTLKNLGINEIKFDGSSQISLAPSIPKVVFELHTANLNVDDLLAQMDNGNAATTSDSSSQSSTNTTTAVETEPDLSATRELDVSGKITIDALTASNAKMQNVVTQFKVDRGVIDLQRFSANLYDGSVSANARIDARKDTPSYTVHKEIKGVQVQPLLEDVADIDLVSGTGNITADISGSSLIVDKAKQNLGGVVKINFADGSLYGVNIAYQIRSVQALLTGQKLEDDTAKKTDFAALTSTMKLSKGVMTTNDLSLQSPLLRVLGDGQVNYVDETVDLLITTSIVGTLKGQGGEDVDQLKDITLPIAIKGSWESPSIVPDIEAALSEQTKAKAQEKIDEAKEKAQKEVDRGIDKLLGDDDSGKNDELKEAAGNLINGLFN